MYTRTPRVVTFGWFTACLLAAHSLAAEPVQFNRDIRPIFASHCVACHGGVKAAGNLSLIYRDKALAKAKSGQVPIVPGQPDNSELLKRVTSHDPEHMMPKPGKDRKPLSATEIALLTEWIRQGAAWSEHWSFVPPVEAAAPAIKDHSWASTKADRFILSRLEAEGLKPSPAASDAEWLRRVTLDLTGLAPTVDEYEAYRAEAKNDLKVAKEHVVDRLLASPSYGERWASVWLDLARYADTFGFEKDPNRDIWPWRDWVIRAFNADMPYDQFTIKQLAGDLLPNPTSDDILATAFHRNTQNNTEGGTNDEEWRMAAVVDRVNTTWTAWQATTFGCVMCHSHPYDPIPQRDYYRYAAFFDNSEDCDIDSDFPRFVVAKDPSQQADAAKFTLELRRLRETMNDAGRKLAGQTSDWKSLTPTSASTTSGALTIGENGRVQASGTLNIGVTYTISLPVRPGLSALRLKIFPDSDDPKKWPERGAVLSNLQASLVDADEKKKTPVKLKEVIADFLAGPFDPQETLEKTPGGFGGYPSLTGPRWCVVILESPLPQTEEKQSLELIMKQSAVADGNAQAQPIRKFEWAGSADAGWHDLMIDPARVDLWKQADAAKAKLAKIVGTRVPVLMERSAEGRRDTRIFIRGNRANKDESVEPGLPQLVHGPSLQRRMSRLDLARWMVSDDNALTARVMANRLWAEIFGRGIVETLEDFGTSGARPTHPELLDHLALRFSHDQHWSIKSFLREIALSSTYGQTCRTTAALMQKDASNILLARGPRVRLTAEMVRDQGLVVSGLLSSKQFGPPVYPPQPDGVWKSVYSGAKWTESKGEDRYRRAIYTYCKRTSGYPGFLTFDAPTRDACTARRVSTNTPLQALLTLNDPAFIEMASALTKRMREGGGEPRDMIARGCKLLTLEDPSKQLVDSLAGLYADSLKAYEEDPKLAKKLADSPESAAMVLVANTLLNLDISITR